MTVVRTVPRPFRDRLGEGPLWSPRENALFWTDILGRKLHRLSLADDAVRSWDLPETIGWVIERRGGGFIAGLRSGFVELDLEPFAIRPIADPEAHLPHNRFNDAKADAAGRIWAGSMPLAADAVTGNLWRLDPDRSVTRADTGYTIANGPALGVDGRTFYHTDSKLARIYAFDLGDDGTLANRRTHIQFEPGWGSPDGMTVDAEDHLWVACWGGACVRRFTPGGRFDRAVELPAKQITSCTFAGPNLDRMFVTSAWDGLGDAAPQGELFEVDPGVKGLPTQMFGG